MAQFNGVMLGSDNPKALGEFYTKVLGKPGFEQDGWYGWMEGAQLVIGEHSAVRGKNERPERIMLALVVPDVKTEFTRITGLGAAAVAEPYQPKAANGGWLATVADPDGNYIQISTPWQ